MSALLKAPVTSLDELPLCLYAPDMARIFGISEKRVYALAAEGAFDWAENKPRIGRISWSRVRLEQYFNGEIRGITAVRHKRSA